jgi:hypothetical protein
MSDSVKKKHLESIGKASRKVLQSSIAGAASTGVLTDELATLTAYWTESVQQLRGEEFGSIEDAIKRVVELAADTLGEVAAGDDTRAFMYDMLLSSEEIVEILRASLVIRS